MDDTEVRAQIAAILANGQAMKESIDRIEGQISGLATRTEFEALRERVKGLESDRTWAIRILVGGLAAAVLAFIVRGGMAP